MVKEMRKIILSKDEIMAALESYKRSNFEFLPPGKIVSCQLKAGGPIIVGFERTDGATDHPLEFSLEQQKLLEPMIRFCLENNIVLPRNSRKSALTGEDQVALFIQMGPPEEEM